MKNLYKHTLLMYGLALSFSAFPASITKYFGVVHIRGKIEVADAQKLQGKLTGDVKKVEVTSAGGNVIEAISLGKILRQSGLTLFVDDYCVSACAFMFAIAEKRAVNEGGFVAFHAGEWAWYASLMPTYLAYEPKSEALKEKFNAGRKEKIAKFENQKNALSEAFVRENLDTKWIDTLNALTSPKVLTMTIDEDSQTISAEATPATCDWWIPDRQGLAEIGIAVSPYVMPERKRISNVLKTRVGRIYWDSLTDIQKSNTNLCETTSNGNS